MAKFIALAAAGYLGYAYYYKLYPFEEKYPKFIGFYDEGQFCIDVRDPMQCPNVVPANLQTRDPFRGEFAGKIVATSMDYGVRNGYKYMALGGGFQFFFNDLAKDAVSKSAEEMEAVRDSNHMEGLNSIGCNDMNCAKDPLACMDAFNAKWDDSTYGNPACAPLGPGGVGPRRIWAVYQIQAVEADKKEWKSFVGIDTN